MNTAIVQCYLDRSLITVSVDLGVIENVHACGGMDTVASILAEYDICICNVDFIDVPDPMINRLLSLVPVCKGHTEHWEVCPDCSWAIYQTDLCPNQIGRGAYNCDSPVCSDCA